MVKGPVPPNLVAEYEDEGLYWPESDHVVVSGCPGPLLTPGVRPLVPVETPSFADQLPGLSVHVSIELLIKTRAFSGPEAVPVAVTCQVT
jgi:hypothetical protein